MDTSDTGKFLLAEVTIPVMREMVDSVVGLAAKIAQLLSFDSKDTYNLEVAVGEAVLNAVEHYSDAGASNESVQVGFFLSDGALIVSVRERGIPFTHNSQILYSSDSLESMQHPGLGRLLMEKSMDKVLYLSHGRSGKETRLIKYLQYGSLPDCFVNFKIKPKKDRRPTVLNPIIREAVADDLEELCRLAWRCYGYTHEDLLYNIEKLHEKFNAGGLKSVVAYDPDSGNMIGHMGLKYSDPDARVPELGLAFIDPNCRNPGLTEKMSAEIFALSQKNGDRGIFAYSVTTHIFSQRALQKYIGSRPCSIFLGVAPVDMEVKELVTSKQEKGSIVNNYFAFDRSLATVYPPAKHSKMIASIYSWLELPRDFVESDCAFPEGVSSISISSVPVEFNVSYIIVESAGADIIEEVKRAFATCRRERKDCIFAFLPLSVEYSPRLVQIFEDMGFFFAGIIPHVHGGGERIVLQYVDIPIEPEKILLFSDMSKELFAYVLAQKEEAKSF